MGNKERRQSLKKTIITTKYLADIIWKDGKSILFIKGFMALVNALIPLSYTLMPGLIINELTSVRRTKMLLIYVGILTLTPIASHLVNMVSNSLLQRKSMSFRLKTEAEFYNHVASMDYELFEKPDVQIMKERAQNVIHRLLKVVDQLGSLITSVFSILATTSIIITINPFLLILVILIIYVNSVATKKANHEQFLLSQQETKYHRYIGGLAWMLNDISYGKEIRLFDLKFLLINIIKDNRKALNKLNIKKIKITNKTSTIHAFTKFLQQVVLYIYLIYCVIYRGLTVGSLTIYMTAVGQVSDSLNRVMQAYLDITKDSLYVQELMEFMKISPQYYDSGDKNPIYDKNSVIEFKNVSFKYPGNDNYALKNINLKINGNEKLCIVGSNGSGKTTFIKLLTRLYKPESGEILLNGININEYDYAKYQKLFAPVFQDYCLYYLSLGENIVLSGKYNKTRLNDIAIKSGLEPLLHKLPKKMDTPVYKLNEEDGFNPSGGEGQKIAIARAIYRDAEIYLLDEPTAALDPLAENEIYEAFNAMTKNKSAILITHRLSAVQLADKVAVFSDGKLIEYGTHKELYKNNGIYTDMYNKQSQFYINNDK